MSLIEEVARRFFGEPNEGQSKPNIELRFGTNGSKCIDLVKNRWYDHETHEGGGPLDLVKREMGFSTIADCYEWLAAEGFSTDGYGNRREVAHYDYVDENGIVLFQVVRFEPKTFRQRRPNGHGGWTWKVKGTRQVPYRLPELVEGIGNAHHVMVVEGEKDVDALRRWNIVATCNAGGAGKFSRQLIEHFRGADVVIVGDNDDAGREHVADVAGKLRGVAGRVRVLDLVKVWPQCPAKGDISDWIARGGGTVEQLNAIVEALGEYKPNDPKTEFPTSQWVGEKLAVVPPTLIKGLLPQTGVAMIGGQSGSGKTFQAIHLGVRLIPQCNQHWYIDQYQIKRHGGVLYFVLEGRPAFPMRVSAAIEDILGKQMKLGEAARLPFAWNFFEPNLFEKGPDTLIQLAERDAARMRREFGVDMVAVFLDTMGLAACYENEDKAAQVQKVVSGLFKLSDATGALVVGVDHYGKNQDAGLRGSSAKRGHVETILACLVDRDEDEKPDNHRLKLEKIRDGEEGRVIPYRLKAVDWGTDDDGAVVSTCVVHWEVNREPPERKQRKERREKHPKTDLPLELAIREVKLPADLFTLRTAFYKFHGGEAHAANTAWNRALKASDLTLNSEGKFDRAP
jgi:RecA-family ATPase